MRILRQLVERESVTRAQIFNAEVAEAQSGRMPQPNELPLGIHRPAPDGRSENTRRRRKF